MNKNLVSSILGFGVILMCMFLLAACQPTENVVMAAELSKEDGIVYAMAPVDLKLFNAAETSPANKQVTMHPADRKFFNNDLGWQRIALVTSVHAADRKFFTNNYLEGTSTLTNVHPADRKFFTDNYLGSLTRDNFDYEQAAESMAFRWQAMADAYQSLGLLNYGSNPDDVMAYRWQAMAAAYEKAGLLNDTTDAGDADALRWQAMAATYEKAGLLTGTMDAGDADALRWQAIAREYENPALSNN